MITFVKAITACAVCVLVIVMIFSTILAINESVGENEDNDEEH